MLHQQWRTLSGEVIHRPLLEEIDTVLANETRNGNAMKVCIGTDSQVKGRITVFATAIVFLRKGKGGFMYIHSHTTRQKMTVKQRMLVEVNKSVEIAYELCNLFSRYSVDMEVHADINTNPNFKSHEALKEAMGYIMGVGFDFNAKPYAFASSSCANKAVQ